MTPLDKAWSLLKELQPAFQDAPGSQDLRHEQNMQNMLDIYTPRGNTNPKYIQQNAGAKPIPFWGEEYYEQNPWTKQFDLNLQADTSRNPRDARMFRQQAEAVQTKNPITPQTNPTPNNPMAGADLEEMQRLLAEAHRRFVAPLSYRRKVKPFSDQEMNRQLNDIRSFRNRRGFQ